MTEEIPPGENLSMHRRQRRIYLCMELEITILFSVTEKFAHNSLLAEE